MMRLVLLVFSLVIFVGRWIDGLDLVHGFCRDAGTLGRLSFSSEGKTNHGQDCGIRD